MFLPEEKDTRIKHISSFIMARLQRKLRKFSENLLPASWVSTLTYTKGLGSPVPLLGSWVPGSIYEIDTSSRVLGHTFSVPDLGSLAPPIRWVPGLRSHQQSRVLGPIFRTCGIIVPNFFKKLMSRFQATQISDGFTYRRTHINI